MGVQLYCRAAVHFHAYFSILTECISVQIACGGCNTMAVVEHDASLVLKDYETVTKELDDLLPKKHPAPPAGLLIGPNAGIPYSPSDGGMHLPLLQCLCNS